MLKLHPPLRPTALTLALACVLGASGCSSVGDMLAGDKVDYRNSGSKTVNLAVPPDLTQLGGQSRYGQPPSTVSANAMATANAGRDAGAVETTANVAVNQLGDIKLERSGQTRWLALSAPPEKIWDQVKAFWLDSGFELTIDQPATGTLQTNWSENRAKIPESGIRKLLGGVFDTLIDTGERDQFRTRIERTAQGSEIYISHRGLTEVYENDRKEQTKWVARPSDPALEGEMLSRLMSKLGAPKEAAAAAKTEVSRGAAAAPATPARARLEADGVTLAADDDFDTTWRRVGLALDRGGFTIEDRDRSQGVYEIRLAPPTDPNANKPGLFSRLFGSSGNAQDALARYRVKVTGQGSGTVVRVLNSKGEVENSNTGRKIAKQLLDELS